MIKSARTTWNYISKEDRLQALIIVLIFVLALCARLIPGPRTIDDAYITYRYASNILAGNGFVYNPGERVLGTTTPFYTILLTGIGFTQGGSGVPFETIALTINAIADGVSCILLILLGKRMGSPMAGYATSLVWAIAPYSVTFAIGGLETSLYVLLLILVTYAYITDHYIQAAIISAFALLTRPDALILIGPLCLDRAWTFGQTKFRKQANLTDNNNQYHTSQPTWRSILLEMFAFATPITVYIIFSMIYFGNPIPHSIAAKSLAYRLPANAALIRLLQHYATPFLEHLTFGNKWIALGMTLYPFLYLVGGLKAYRREHRIWPFIAYPWLYFIIFAIANPLIFRWYLTPPLPPLMFMILMGADEIIQRILNWFTHRYARYWKSSSVQLPTIGAFIFVIMLPFMFSARGWSLHPDHGLGMPAPKMAWYQLELLYKSATEIISRDTSTRTDSILIAAGDVGVIGYYTGAKILDTVGLNSPQSLDYYPLDSTYYVINYAIPPDLIWDYQPDYVIILEVYGRNGLLIDPRFTSGYKLVEKIPTDIYGSDGMLIFKKAMN